MGLVTMIFGKGAHADALQDADAVRAALARLENERAAAQKTIAAAHSKRCELLLVDGSDEAIGKLDNDVDAAHLVLERCDAVAPSLHARLRDFQDANRRALLDELQALYHARVDALDSAMSAVLGPLADYLEIARQLDASGFEAEARSFVATPPLAAGGIIVGEEALERWRRECERIADMRSALPRPSKPAAPRPANKTPQRVQLQDEAYRPAPLRAPRKVSEPPSFGFARVAILRNGVEIETAQYVTGDEVILENSAAERLARSGACDILERGTIERVAE